MIPKKLAPDLIRGGRRFPAFAKPASAGEARSDKIMLKIKQPRRRAAGPLSPPQLEAFAECGIVRWAS
jgi:hypothetical protein